MKRILPLIAATFVVFFACDEIEKIDTDRLSGANYSQKSYAFPWQHSQIDSFVPEYGTISESFVEFYSDLEAFSENSNHCMGNYSIFDAFWLSEATINYRYCDITDTNTVEVMDTFSLVFDILGFVEDTPFVAGAELASELIDIEHNIMNIPADEIKFCDIELFEVNEQEIIIRCIFMYTYNEVGMLTYFNNNPVYFSSSDCRKSCLPGICYSHIHMAPPPSACEELERRVNPYLYQPNIGYDFISGSNIFLGVGKVIVGLSGTPSDEYFWDGNTMMDPISGEGYNGLNYYIDKGIELVNAYGSWGTNNIWTFHIDYQYSYISTPTFQVCRHGGFIWNGVIAPLPD